MATAKQATANRRNAAKSTGPRTKSGKARSSGNALKHGLSAEQKGAMVGPLEPKRQSNCPRDNIGTRKGGVLSLRRQKQPNRTSSWTMARASQNVRVTALTLRQSSC